MASKWSLNERTARKLDEAASAAVKDALDKMDAVKAAEEGGSVERAEKVSGMSEEELFSFAEYDPHKGEKIGYTEYSYWRSTLRTFLHNKVAIFFLALMGLLVLFTIIQPLLPNQADPNKIFFNADGLARSNEQPGGEFIFGTNNNPRCI